LQGVVFLMEYNSFFLWEVLAIAGYPGSDPRIDRAINIIYEIHWKGEGINGGCA
jgi:hypothetical protein